MTVRERRAQSGQTATEYMLLISVIVLAVVASAYAFVAPFAEGVNALGAKVQAMLSTGMPGQVGGTGTGPSGPMADGPSGPSSSSACFVAGTLVETAGGPVPIEAIREGDVVFALGEETGVIAHRPVTTTFVHDDIATWEVVAASPAREEAIDTTADHRFFVEDRGWVAASDIAAGDALVAADGVPLRVVSVRATGERATVYNFEVDTDHNYFVGASRIWVHNAKAAPPDVGNGGVNWAPDDPRGGALGAPVPPSE